MHDVNIQRLFYHNRFGDFHGITTLLFMLYIPCGVVLVLFRCLISIQYVVFLMVLPKGFFLRKLLMWFYFGIMGIFISIGGTKHKKEKVSMIVSNHVTFLDSLAMEVVVSSWRLQDHTKVPSWFAWLFGLKNPQVRWMEDVKTLEDKVSDYPYAFFPEEETTHGKVGLLKFNSSPFKLVPGYLQPIVILIHRPWFIPINANYSQSTFWSDLFWFLFVPVTMIHMSYLPAVQIEDDENRLDDFVQTLQKDMAYVLGIQATNCMAYDKNEYIKRTLHEERMKQEQVIASSNHRAGITHNRQVSTGGLDQIDKMVGQVRVVLPQIPADVIRKDIQKTKDVDTTITNLLEGSITYTPLTVEEQENIKEQENKKEQEKEVSRPINTSPKLQVFANSYKDRQLSFQEKKARMIDEARSKYLLLHPEYS